MDLPKSDFINKLQLHGYYIIANRERFKNRTDANKQIVQPCQSLFR